jgi:hypothetical protein
VTTGPRFLSPAEVATRFPDLADAIKSNRERDEARLSEVVMQLKTGSRPFNLLNCLTVLLEDHRLREEVAAEASARQQAKFAEQVIALTEALEIAASKKKSVKVTVPTVIAGMFTAADLRNAVVEHQNEVKQAREEQKGNWNYSVDVNWQSYAERILPTRLREVGEPDVRHPNATAWTRASDWLIANARTIGMDRNKIEKWVRRSGKAKKSTDLTVEFGRLDRERAHLAMMKHLRDDIAQTAQECIRTVQSIGKDKGGAEEVPRVLMWTIRDTWTVVSGLARFCTKPINALPDTVFSLAEIREKLHELLDLVFDQVVDAAGGGRSPPPETEDENSKQEGPVGGRWVFWKGVRYDVPTGVVYRLIFHMWTREFASYDSLWGIDGVFDSEQENHSVSARVSEVNRCLKKIGTPWRLSADSRSRIIVRKESGNTD